ncbi:hypothetical protein ES703_88090 [subsurface metagenome]
MKGSTALFILGVAGFSALITYALIQNPEIVIAAAKALTKTEKKEGEI